MTPNINRSSDTCLETHDTRTDLVGHARRPAASHSPPTRVSPVCANVRTVRTDASHVTTAF
jgi:hypothetical protein